MKYTSYHVHTAQLPTVLFFIALYLVLQGAVGYIITASFAQLTFLSMSKHADMRVLAWALAVPASAGMVIWGCLRNTYTKRLVLNGLVRPGWGWIMLAPLIAIAYAMLASLYLNVTGSSASGNQVIQQWALHASLWIRLLLACCVVVVVPMIEEVLFRGLLLSALLQKASVTVAVIISALLFAFAHMLNHLMWPLIPVFIGLGILFAWLRLASGSLWTAIVAHAVNNGFAVIFWFMAV